MKASTAASPNVDSNFSKPLLYMKQIIWLGLTIYYATNCYSQTTKVNDNTAFKLSLVGDPPMPRENERYNVGLDLSKLKTSLFEAFKKNDSSTKTTPYSNREIIKLFSINQLKKGENIIDAIHFDYGGLSFITDALNYYVYDSLPNTNEGLWIRHFFQNDSSFYLSIEQRIPIEYDEKDDLAVILKHNHVCQQMVTLNPAKSKFNIFNYTQSGNGCSMRSSIINGQKKYYFYQFFNYSMTIKPHKEKIEITKSDFSNMPEKFNFPPIIIK